MAFIFLFFLLPCTLGQASDNNPIIPATLQKLRTDLLKNYDKTIRPSKNESLPINVSLLFDLRNIVSLDEKYQILTVKGILKLKWIDEYLIWSPNNYEGIETIRFSLKDIWNPEIQSFHNVKPVQMYKENSISAIVYYNGTVTWYPTEIFDVPCSTSFRHYPFDTHNCSLVFGSWSYAGRRVDLEMPVESQIIPTSQIRSTAWLFLNATYSKHIEVVNVNYFYPTIIVNIFLQRASRIYRYICVVPTLISITTILAGFWVLPNEPSRYIIGCSNVLMISFLLQHLALSVPAGKDLPLIAEYSASCLCMSALFLVVSIIVNIVGELNGSPPNSFVRFARHTLEKYLCLSSFSYKEGDKNLIPLASDNAKVVTSFKEVQKNQDWILVAMTMDRIMFWLFIIIYVIILSVLASV